MPTHGCSAAGRGGGREGGSAPARCTRCARCYAGEGAGAWCAHVSRRGGGCSDARPLTPYCKVAHGDMGNVRSVSTKTSYSVPSSDMMYCLPPAVTMAGSRLWSAHRRTASEAGGATRWGVCGRPARQRVRRVGVPSDGRGGCGSEAQLRPPGAPRAAISGLELRARRASQRRGRARWPASKQTPAH